MTDPEPSERSQRPVWLGQDKRRWDHVRIHVTLLKDGRVTCYHLAVYMGIVAHAELASGRAFPAASTLAEYGQMSDRKVRECIIDLRAWGYVEIEHRDGAASVYTLLPPPSTPAHGSGVEATDDASTPAHGSGVEGASAEPCADPPRHTVPPTPAPGADEQEPENKNQMNHSSKTEEELWRKAREKLAHEQERAARGERDPIEKEQAWMAQHVQRLRDGVIREDPVDQASRAQALLRERGDAQTAAERQALGEQRVGKEAVSEQLRRMRGVA